MFIYCTHSLGDERSCCSWLWEYGEHFLFMSPYTPVLKSRGGCLFNLRRFEKIQVWKLRAAVAWADQGWVIRSRPHLKELRAGTVSLISSCFVLWGFPTRPQLSLLHVQGVVWRRKVICGLMNLNTWPSLCCLGEGMELWGGTGLLEAVITEWGLRVFILITCPSFLLCLLPVCVWKCNWWVSVPPVTLCFPCLLDSKPLEL